MRRLLWMVCGVCVLAMGSGGQAANKYVVPPGTPGVTPDGLYESWGTAATSLHHVVALAGAHTIWVTNGHYYLTNQVTVASAGVKINGFSGNPADVKINGNYPSRTNRCFYVSGANVTLNALTLTNGYAVGTTATGHGGGVWLNAGGALITNCIIVGNRAAYYGGGVEVWNHGVAKYTIVRTQIRGNRALHPSGDGRGGALHMRRGICIISNQCVISGNYATNGTVGTGGGGGAFYFTSPTATGRVYQTRIANNMAISSGGAGSVPGGTFVDCVIVSNTAGYSGGLSAPKEVSNCTLAYNHATFRWGGALNMAYGGYSLVSNCQFYGNSCALSYGGGIHVQNQRADIVDCLFSNNVNDCSSGVTLAYGGGLAYNTATGFVRNCTFVNNRTLKGTGSQYGGGLGSSGTSQLTVERCTFKGNTGPLGGAAGVTNAVFQSCKFVSNTGTTEGASIYLRGRVSAINCTLADNVSTLSGGVAAYGNGTGNALVNCIVQGNTNSVSGLTANHPNVASLPFTNSCTAPLPPAGTGNINVNPQFENRTAGNYRLLGQSQCINAGLYQSWMDTALDLDGVARIEGAAVDMGCYEFYPRGTVIHIR